MMGAVAARLKATEKSSDFFAPRKIFGRMVLPREGGGGLAEGGYYVVNKIFEIDGHRAPRNCGGAEGVDQGLDKNVRKAENRSRKSRRHACFENFGGTFCGLFCGDFDFFKKLFFS